MEDYEKKYKETLNRAKKWYYAPNADKMPTYANRIIKEIFPELKESEDEKIRKALIRFHKSTIDIDGIKGADILAWIEKQGKKQPIIVWHSINEEPEEMKELFCEWESDDATWHDVAFYDKESHTFRHAKMPINVTKWIYVDELLEKQGEQKTDKCCGGCNHFKYETTDGSGWCEVGDTKTYCGFGTDCNDFEDEETIRRERVARKEHERHGKSSCRDRR